MKSLNISILVVIRLGYQVIRLDEVINFPKSDECLAKFVIKAAEIVTAEL